MDRGAWWATVRGVARFGYNLATSSSDTGNLEANKVEHWGLRLSLLLSYFLPPLISSLKGARGLPAPRFLGPSQRWLGSTNLPGLSFLCFSPHVCWAGGPCSIPHQHRCHPPWPCHAHTQLSLMGLFSPDTGAGTRGLFPFIFQTPAKDLACSKWWCVPLLMSESMQPASFGQLFLTLSSPVSSPVLSEQHTCKDGPVQPLLYLLHLA